MPDLVVEVVSPTDVAYNSDEKPEEYRAVGVPLVRVVNPDSRVIRVRAFGQAMPSCGTASRSAATPSYPASPCPSPT